MCNFVTPVHRMVRIFPTIDKSADTTGNTPKSELSTTEFHLTPPNPGAQGDSVGENVETPGVDNAIASTSTAFLDQSSSPAADEETQEAGGNTAALVKTKSPKQTIFMYRDNTLPSFFFQKQNNNKYLSK